MDVPENGIFSDAITHLLSILCVLMKILLIIIIIIKRISRAPIYYRRWEHRALYNY